MELEEFYQRCAGLLGTEHDYHDPPKSELRLRYDGTISNTYKNRWNNRDAGNGRFPGRGIVRVYGPSCVYVVLRDPPLVGTYPSLDDALTAIRQAIDENQTEDAATQR